MTDDGDEIAENLKGKRIQRSGKFSGKILMRMEKGASPREDFFDFLFGKAFFWYLLVCFLVAAIFAVYHIRYNTRMKQELSIISMDECEMENELKWNPEMSPVANFNVTANSTRGVILCLNRDDDLGYINHKEIGKLWLDIYIKPYMSNVSKGNEETEGAAELGSGARPID